MPSGPWDRAPAHGAAMGTEPLEAALDLAADDHESHLQLEGGILSPKVGEVAADLIWDPKKLHSHKGTEPFGRAHPRATLLCRRGFPLEDEAEKDGKALSVCSTRVEDSGRASSSKKSSLRVPSSDFSEYTEMAAMNSDKTRMTPTGIILGQPDINEPHMGPAVAAVRSLTRSGRVARKLTRHIVERVERVQRRRSTRSATRRMPAPLVPAGTPPLFTMHVRDVTIDRIRAVMERTEDCPLLRFLEEEFLCSDFCTTDWMYSCDTGSAKVRQSDYTMPVPRDIPEVAARLLRVPETISGTTVWRLNADSRELLLVQHSHTKDVLFGDRFKLQNTMSFVQEPAGGVTVSTWTDVIWVTPLPWTHGVIKHVIEKKAKSDSAAVVGQLVKMIQEAASE